MTTPRNVHLLGDDWRRRLQTFVDDAYFHDRLRHDILHATAVQKGTFLQRNLYKHVPPSDFMPRAMLSFPTIDDVLIAAAKIAFMMASPIGVHIWGVSVERRIKGEGYVVFLKCDEQHVDDVVRTALDVLEYQNDVYTSVPIFGKQNQKVSSVDVARRQTPAPYLFLDD